MSVVFFVLSWLIHLYAMVIMIRFLGHAFGLPYTNQVMQLLYNLTCVWSVGLRKCVPVVRGFDLSLLLAAYGLFLLQVSLPSLLVGFGFEVSLFFKAFALLFSLVVDIFFFAILITIIVSFLVPGLYHPAIQAAHTITEPLLRPARRILPPVSGFDLSPILVILCLKTFEMVLLNVMR